MDCTAPSAPPVPQPDRADVAVPAPGAGPGHWAGAPSAMVVGGIVHLAYRLRRPVGDGRGYVVVLARSEDGLSFETVAELHKDTLETESLERPALVALPDGGWRLYISCATPGSLHWSVDAIDADDLATISSGTRRTTLPGDALTAVKDPVVLLHKGRWNLWACVHPLGDASEAARMSSRYATSDDGLVWQWVGTALEGRAGAWDQRGARITSVLLSPHRAVAYYDGRATATENWEERTGLAFGAGPASFRADGAEPSATSPFSSGALRYTSVVRLPEGGYRLYYEASRPDGAHDLCTELIPPG